MKYYLYNSLANNGIKPDVAPGTELVDAVGLDYPEYLKNLAPEDEVVPRSKTTSTFSAAGPAMIS